MVAEHQRLVSSGKPTNQRDGRQRILRIVQKSLRTLLMTHARRSKHRLEITSLDQEFTEQEKHMDVTLTIRQRD